MEAKKINSYTAASYGQNHPIPGTHTNIDNSKNIVRSSYAQGSPPICYVELTGHKSTEYTQPIHPTSDKSCDSPLELIRGNGTDDNNDRSPSVSQKFNPPRLTMSQTWSESKIDPEDHTVYNLPSPSEYVCYSTLVGNEPIALVSTVPGPLMSDVVKKRTVSLPAQSTMAEKSIVVVNNNMLSKKSCCSDPGSVMPRIMTVIDSSSCSSSNISVMPSVSSLSIMDSTDYLDDEDRPLTMDLSDAGAENDEVSPRQTPNSDLLRLTLPAHLPALPQLTPSTSKLPLTFDIFQHAVPSAFPNLPQLIPATVPNSVPVLSLPEIRHPLTPVNRNTSTHSTTIAHRDEKIHEPATTSPFCTSSSTQSVTTTATTTTNIHTPMRTVQKPIRPLLAPQPPILQRGHPVPSDFDNQSQIIDTIPNVDIFSFTNGTAMKLGSGIPPFITNNGGNNTNSNVTAIRLHPPTLTLCPPTVSSAMPTSSLYHTPAQTHLPQLFNHQPQQQQSQQHTVQLMNFAPLNQTRVSSAPIQYFNVAQMHNYLNPPGMLVHSLSGSPGGHQTSFTFGAAPPPGLGSAFPQPGSMAGYPQFLSGAPLGSRLSVMPPPPPLAPAPSVLTCCSGDSTSHKIPINFSPASLVPTSSSLSTSHANSCQTFFLPPGNGLLAGVAKSVSMDTGYLSIASSIEASLDNPMGKMNVPNQSGSLPQTGPPGVFISDHTPSSVSFPPPQLTPWSCSQTELSSTPTNIMGEAIYSTPNHMISSGGMSRNFCQMPPLYASTWMAPVWNNNNNNSNTMNALCLSTATPTVSTIRLDGGGQPSVNASLLQVRRRWRPSMRGASITTSVVTATAANVLTSTVSPFITPSSPGPDQSPIIGHCASKTPSPSEPTPLDNTPVQQQQQQKTAAMPDYHSPLLPSSDRIPSSLSLDINNEVRLEEKKRSKYDGPIYFADEFNQNTPTPPLIVVDNDASPLPFPVKSPIISTFLPSELASVSSPGAIDYARSPSPISLIVSHPNSPLHSTASCVLEVSDGVDKRRSSSLLLPPITSSAEATKTDWNMSEVKSSSRKNGLAISSSFSTRRRIITHVLDDYVIYESNLPFPVRNAMSVVEATILEVNKAVKLSDTASEPPESHIKTVNDEEELTRKSAIYQSSNGYPESGATSCNRRKLPSPASSAGSSSRRNSATNQRKRRSSSSSSITPSSAVVEGEEVGEDDQGNRRKSSPLPTPFCEVESGGKKKKSFAEEGVRFTPPPLNGQQQKQQRLPPTSATSDNTTDSQKIGGQQRLCSEEETKILPSRMPATPTTTPLPLLSSAIQREGLKVKIYDPQALSRERRNSGTATSNFTISPPNYPQPPPLIAAPLLLQTASLSQPNSFSGRLPPLHYHPPHSNPSHFASPPTPSAPPPPGDIRKWSPGDVADFVRSTPSCAPYAEAFLVNEIDGEALLLLSKEQFTQIPIGMKMGPALKLAARLEPLRIITNNETAYF